MSGEMNRMIQQRDEFLALRNLAEAFEALPTVMDDDFPGRKSFYEAKLREFLAAAGRNGRTIP